MTSHPPDSPSGSSNDSPSGSNEDLDLPSTDASSAGGADRAGSDRPARGRGRPRGGRGGGGPRGRGDGPRREARDELSHLGKLVALVAKALVDHPEEVVVREAQDEHHPRVELTVAEEDIGKIIGKDGRTAQSIRTLLSAAAARSGRRPHLDILD
jgi:hypothetical protein